VSRRDGWSVLEPLLRALYGDAATGLLGDVIEGFHRERRHRGRVRAASWLLLDLWGVLLRGLAERRRTRFASPTRDRVLTSVLMELRSAVRGHARSPGFALIAVVTLATGVGACATLFSVANSVLWRPLPYPDSDRLVRLGAVREITMTGGRSAGFASSLTVLPPRVVMDLQSSLRSFRSVAGLIRVRLDLAGEGEARRVDGAAVSWTLGDVLGMPVAQGRWFDASDDDAGSGRVVVISDRLWRDTFGSDPSIVGRRVMLAGDPRTISGVLAPTFRGPEALGMTSVDAWIPIRQSGRDPEELNNAFVQVLARLRSDVEPPAALAELQSVTRRLAEGYPASSTASELRTGIESLRDLTIGGARRTILLLFGAAGLLLLIAGVNLAHLLLAHGADRAGELAVRTALGASRGRIARQLLLESAILAVAGGVAGAVLATAGVSAFRSLSPESFPRAAEVTVDGRALLFAIGVAVLTGLIFGAVPVARRTDSVLTHLRDGTRAGTGPVAARTRSGLVVLETTLAVVLLCGAALLTNSFIRLLRVDPGLNADAHELVVIAGARHDTRDARVSLFRELRDRLAALPAVESVGMTNGEAFGGASAGGNYRIEGREPTSEYVRWELIDDGFVPSIGARLVAGRNLGAAEIDARAPVVLVNESFERLLFPGESAVGHRMKVIETNDEAPWLTIVGVIGDMSPGDLSTPAYPDAYVSYTVPGFLFDNMTYIARSRGGAAIGSQLREAVREAEPDVPVLRTNRVRDRISISLIEPRFYLVVLGTFAGAAILLSVIGLYGTLACTLAARRREFGVRVVLGATRPSLFRLLFRTGLLPVGIGTGGGLAVSAWLSRLLRNFVFGVGVTDGLTYAGVALLVLIAGGAACLVPALRASRSDPRSALFEG
jgi:putative ABC transport system permease protein